VVVVVLVVVAHGQRLVCCAMAIDPVLRSLLTATGPSGYETAPAAVWREAASAFAEVQVDVMGSSIARVPGTGGGPTLAIVGHIDEIGLVVTHIDDNGFLYFIGVGGWDAQILVGQRVEVTTRDGVVPGVIGKKPIHLLKDDDRKKVAEIKELHIDIGARDADDARGLVRIGDVAVIAGEPVELPNGRAASRSMDNRLGCYVAYEAARLVAEAGGAPGDVVAVAAVQEEITFGGSRTTAYSLEPDLAVVVDVTHATDAPGIEVKELGKHEFGSGPVVERGSILNPAIFELLHATAEEGGIPFTVAASAGRTGTDADAVHFSRAGVPCGLIGLPLRYMHSPVEMVQLDDIANAARLLAAFAQRLTAGTSFER
jgi:putative aminopeptidase FrvX